MLPMTQASGRVGSRLWSLSADAIDHHASGQCAAPVCSPINLNQWLAAAAGLRSRAGRRTRRRIRNIDVPPHSILFAAAGAGSASLARCADGATELAWSAGAIHAKWTSQRLRPLVG